MLVVMGESGWLGSLPLDFYSPESFGFLAVFGLPHLAVGRALMLWGLVLLLRAVKRQDPRPAAGLQAGLLWLSAGLFSPINLAVPLLITGLWVLMYGIFRRDALWTHTLRRAVLAGLITLPVIGYQLAASGLDPFFRAWTDQNRIFSPHPAHYLLAYGFYLPWALRGGRRFARAGIQLARLTVPYRVVLADDFERALEIIRADRHLFGYTEQPDPAEWSDGGSAGDPDVQRYVDDLLRYLGAIEWDQEEDAEAACPFNPDHPFCAVFDAIDLIRSDMKELFKARRQADMQRRAMEEKLVQSQKMEAVGLLAGGVAHDLNNVLSGIVSYPELLLMDMPPEAPMREALEAIQASGLKAAAIVEDLLTLSRRGVSVREPIDINALIRAYLGSPEYQALGRHYPGVQVTLNLDEDLMAIRGSASHLRKSLASLVENAVESHEGVGEVRIETANRYLKTPLKGLDTMVEGDSVRLTVIDQGRGIPEKDLQRIFEPFYTKKVMGRSGTGLGMAVVWGTVQDHKGYIDVTSRAGEGTAFHLYFPAMRTIRPMAEAPADATDIAGHGERVLVVDDVHQQREIAVDMLQRLGYRPATAASGEDALAYIEKTPVSLVVLDMIMDPGIDGLETFRRMRRLYPDQKAIIVSGYADDQKVKLAQAMGAGAFVKKPYAYEHFGRAVRSELDRGGPQ